MKVLIIGSHGFVGTNLIGALSHEHMIIRWDVRSDDALPDCDAVIHLVGKAHDTKNVTFEDEYFKVNTELTIKIYNAFLKSEAKKFIFFSSIKAKDNDTPYAKSKKVAEDYIISKKENLRGKRYYILRPCMIHGKGVKGNLPLLFKFVKKGWLWPLAAFENQRSYASIRNVSLVVNELLKRDVESGIYNLCDDESVSTNELIRLMSECLGKKPKMISLPKCVIRLGAKLGDSLHLPLDTESLGKLTGNNVIDNSEIKRAIGFTKMPVNAMDGLKFTIQQMIKNGQE